MSTKKTDPKTLDIGALISLWNASTRTDAVWDRLDELTEGRAVLKLIGSSLDTGAVEKALGFAKRTGRDVPGHKTAAALRAELTQEHDEADPLTGEPLFEGIAPDGADWSVVSKDDRAAVALGVLMSEAGLRGKNSEEIIHAIATGAPPVPRLRKAWADLDKEGETAARVRARLIVKPTAQESAPPRPFVADPSPAQVIHNYAPVGSQVHIGGNVSGSVIVTGNSNTTGAGPLLLVLHHPADRAAFDELNAHAAGMRRGMGLRIVGPSMVPAGAATRNVLDGWQREAVLIVVLMSSSYVADDSLMTRAEDARASGKRVVPVLVSPCMASGVLSGLVSLPRGERAISQSADKGSAWVEVVSGLRQVLEAVRK